MDDEQKLEALSKILTELSSNPYDLSLHVQHIKLTSLPGLEDEANSARQMLTGFWPAGDEIWMPLIDAKIKEGVDTVEAALEVLVMFETAESDYLSIPLLQKHLQFVIDRHAYFTSQTSDLGEEVYFTTNWSRECMDGIVEKCAFHLTSSHLLWDARRDWEIEQLEKTTDDEERTKLVLHIEDLYMERIKQCHSTMDETSTAYSTFTTTYKPAHLYEKLMLAASKEKTHPAKAYSRREPFEDKLVASNFSPEAYNNYIIYERKARKVDFNVLSTLYERAIADTAKRRLEDIENIEYVLRTFWTGYCDAVRQYGQDPESKLSVFKRAVRSVPGCGTVLANYIRFLEGSVQDGAVIAAYSHALETKLLRKNVEDIVSVVLARAGQLRRSIMASEDVGSDVETLFKVLEEGIEMVRKAAPAGDARYRLEKFTAKIYANLADAPELAASVWEKTAKHYKTSYLAWTSYAEGLVDQGKIDEARAVYAEVAGKKVDWPEAIFDAWESFEHLHGSLESLQDCLQKVERAQQQVNTRRAKEAERAAYQAAQVAVETQAATVPVTEAMEIVQETEQSTSVQAMEVDKFISDATRKRKHDEDEGSSSKKVKADTSAPPKRDRENCTVFVANVPHSATEKELVGLFEDCGSVKDTKITDLPSIRVATVEFADRESVPAALTKDKKRINGQEVSVHLAWRSTLYITNFPEKADDGYIRELFEQFGTIFDVRWPSKKFKSSRRFCYLQYTSPEAAEAALSLHGRQLEEGHPLNVYISNPERKKERTDASANERELYIAGLSKFATTADLEKLFKTYGTVKDVRMATDEAGHSKGFAFVEFEDESTAQRALQANNHDLKNRRMAVTMSDSRIRARRPDYTTRIADIKSRSLRIRNLPEGTQEGLLQQALEKTARVKRVEVFQDISEAVVELESVAEAGRLILAQEPITFNDKILKFSEEPQLKHRPPTDGSSSIFVPRAAASKPRAGIGAGKKRQPVASSSSNAPKDPAPAASSSIGKGQDDFRKLLG
ncbi:hypothetical protein SCHPADRAFT_670625 [Schizopora paradoxa]|uniref:U4/U6 snRNA-associated-splicing factor PRP24 n=1 Tax=Schizopora paradoxa TaxID=27342 RepID=A0A0H2R6J2_9AGAM|nr:hypothetical protein SCHPADRAFT_670625 [Schizopora paradoxa]